MMNCPLLLPAAPLLVAGPYPVAGLAGHPWHSRRKLEKSRSAGLAHDDTAAAVGGNSLALRVKCRGPYPSLSPDRVTRGSPDSIPPRRTP
jgi:hypothetical protein